MHCTANEVVCSIRILGANAGPLCLKPACSSVRIRLLFGSIQPHLLSEIGSSSVRLRVDGGSSQVHCPPTFIVFTRENTIKQVLAESVVFGSTSVRLRFDFGFLQLEGLAETGSFPLIRRSGGHCFSFKSPTYQVPRIYCRVQPPRHV